MSARNKLGLAPKEVPIHPNETYNQWTHKLKQSTSIKYIVIEMEEEE